MSNFRADLSRIKASIHGKHELFVRRVGRAMVNEIETGGQYSPGTPVASGFARSNWDAAVGGPPSPGSGERGSAGKVMDGISVGDVVHTSNNAPYIRRLEFGFKGTDKAGRVYRGARFKRVGDSVAKSTPDGHSSQAPFGFARLALKAFQKIVNTEAAAIANG